MINLNLSDYNFLQDIPSSFTIDQVRDTAKVTVFIDGTAIYTTSLYQYNEVVTFYDLRDIIEQYMRDNGLCTALLKVTAEKYGGTDTTDDDIFIIFCSDHHAVDIPENFFLWRFLTNRTYYVIPRSAYQRLTFFTDGQQTFTAFAECIFLKDGVRSSLRVTLNTYQRGHPSEYNLLSHPSHISTLARRQSGNDCGKLLAYTIHADKRAMTYYVTDDEPEVTLCFRNAYNTEEYAYVFGTTLKKTTFDKQEAICQGRHSFYNQSVQRRHEVTTVPLSPEQAEWYNELFASPKVTAEVDQGDNDAIPVLISDITSEISNRPDEKVRMKFSWWFDDNANWKVTDPQTSIFNNVYIDTFQ